MPEEQYEMENSTNLTDTELVEKETVKEPEPEEKKQDLESLNKQLYMRAKKAEEKVKELISKTEPPEGAERFASVDAILEIQTATKGMDEEEVAELRLRAKATGKSLLESRKDENFNLWRDARREKVEKAKALEPSSRQGEEEKKGGPPGPNATLSEIEEYYTKVGFLKKRGNPPAPVFTPRL